MPDSPSLTALRASAARLRDLVTPLDDETLERPAYPSEWSIADVLSHLGSGAVIHRRNLDSTLKGEVLPEDFAPSVWDEWNAKSPRQKADDLVAADAALLDRFEELDEDQWERTRITLGPMQFDLPTFVGLRVNEHALHSWDVAVALDPAATLPADATELVVDDTAMIAGWAGKPTGADRTVVVQTTGPTRTFTIVLTPDGVTVTPGTKDGPPDLTLPAEAFVRLVYGRLDPDHTPAFDGDPGALDELRLVFPGL